MDTSIDGWMSRRVGFTSPTCVVGRGWTWVVPNYVGMPHTQAYIHIYLSLAGYLEASNWLRRAQREIGYLTDEWMDEAS